MSITFEIPMAYKSAILDGSVQRIGAILKDTATGKIIAHVQETGLAQELLKKAGSNLLNPISSFGTLGSSIYSNIQLNHLTNLVQNLQALGFATFGASIIGLGVSVAGFAILSSKMNVLQQSIDGLSEQIEKNFKSIEETRFREHFNKLQGLFSQADQASFLSNSVFEWQNIARELANENAFFSGEIIHLLESKSFDSTLFSNLVHSLSLCNSGRIECLVLSSELEAARRVSSDNSKQYNSLFDDLSPSRLASKSQALITSQNKSSYLDLRKATLEMKELVSGIRELQDISATKQMLFDTMINNKIDGPTYIEQLRNEAHEPILLLGA